MAGDTSLTDEAQELLLVMSSKMPTHTLELYEMHDVFFAATEATFKNALAILQERITPMVLVHGEVSRYKYVNYCLRDLLIGIGKQVEARPGTDASYSDLANWRTIVYERFNKFYDHQNTLSATTEVSANTNIGNNFPHSNNNNAQSGSNVNTTPYQEALISKNKAVAASSFKNEKQKFSGSNDSPPTLHRFRQVYSTVMKE